MNATWYDKEQKEVPNLIKSNIHQIWHAVNLNKIKQK